jgi:anti-sigma28 factor (negative regulator of flagellin synthesis)
MSEEEKITKKVEENFVKEDAETPPHSSFARPEDDPQAKKQKKKPSATEIGLYTAFKLKSIDEKLGQLLLLMANPNPQPEKKVETPKKTEQKTIAKKETSTPSSADSDAVTNLKMMFPKELEDLLLFEQTGDIIKVSPRQYLDKDFGKIASIIREAGGEYHSAGRDSHFTIAVGKLGTSKPVEKKEKKEKATTPSKPVSRQELIEQKLKKWIDSGNLAINTEASATMFVVEIKEYLGGENFAQIARIVKDELGGQYVSQGRASHFDIPKQKA